MRVLDPGFILSMSALLLVACANEPIASAASNEQQSALRSDDTVCAREYPTGSNIPITKCKTRAQIEKEQAAAHETMRRAQTLRPNARMGTD